ncbi:MAG: hypothetical protein ABIL39_11930, partial [candidate division WOR-3 bacterium]
MRGIKVNKIAAVWLMMVVIGLGYAQDFVSPLEHDVEQMMYIRGAYPRVGETFEVVYRIKLKEENRLNMYPQRMVALGYTVHFWAGSTDPIIFLSEKEIFVPILKPGEWREFSVKLKITKKAVSIRIMGGIRFKVSKGCGATINMPLYLIDPETGQYGTREEYERGLSVEYRYDFVDGSFIGRYDQSRVSLEENRRIIKMMKELEPSLTDSLALLLHSEQYKVGVPKGTAKWDSLNQRWIDKGVYEY